MIKTSSGLPQKSSAIFGNLRKFSENVRERSSQFKLYHEPFFFSVAKFKISGVARKINLLIIFFHCNLLALNRVFYIAGHISELRMIIIIISSIYSLLFFFSHSPFSTAAADAFTSRLFDIYEKVWEQGNTQVSTIRLPTPPHPSPPVPPASPAPRPASLTEKIFHLPFH